MPNKKMLRGQVDDDITKDFLEIAARRHGPLYGWKGKGLEEALELYVKTHKM